MSLLRKVKDSVKNGSGGLVEIVVYFVWKRVLGYDHKAYWRMRGHVVNPNSNKSFFVKLYYLYCIKKMDARAGASMGTDLNAGAAFSSSPNLPHGLKGIIIGFDTKIGKNACIFHQVTISHGEVVIGDNVTIGAGAKILPNVTIGNNVKIGANCVVIENIPDNSTVVLPKPRVIIKDK